MVWGFILLLRLKKKNKVFKKSVNYFLALMKDASFFMIWHSLFFCKSVETNRVNFLILLNSK